MAMRERLGPPLLALKVEEGVHEGCKQLLDVGKSEGMGSLLKLPERNTVLPGQKEDILSLAL